MAYKPQPSFSAGEIDPALHERTTLQKYDQGLAKCRNFHVGKTGRLISMPGTEYSAARKYDNRKCIVYYPEYSDYELEFGHEYVRIHDLAAGTYVEETTPYEESDLGNLIITCDKTHAYIFCPGFSAYRMLLGTIDPSKGPGFDFRFSPVIGNWTSPGTGDMSLTASGAPAGYDVEYTATFIITGVETSQGGIGVVSGKLPVATAQYNTIKAKTFSQANSYYIPTEMRVYRRPVGGTSWGYIGSSFKFAPLTGPPAVLEFEFRDIGGEADFLKPPPFLQADLRRDSEIIIPGPTPPFPIISDSFPVGLIYQQRLIVTGQKDLEAIFTSRLNYKSVFDTELEPTAASALALKAGTTGRARVLRLLDGGPLLAFTTAGVYVNGRGALSPDNIGMVKRGNWVVDPKVEPLPVPGGFLFVENSTGAIVFIQYSDSSDSFQGGEITTWSDHLFRGKRVKSWCYQSSEIPTIWVVMDDGTVNALTYLPEQQVAAWSWGDTDGLYETVGVRKNLNGENEVYFTVFRNGKRLREKLADRFAMDFKSYIGGHSSVVFKQTFTGISVAPVTPGVWDDELTLTAPALTFTNSADLGAVGTIFRYFKSNGEKVDLEVITFVDTDEVVVRTVDGREFPSTDVTDVTIYRTWETLTGLSHLEGKEVLVRGDGFIIASPLQPDEYDPIEVTGGEITLDDRFAIVVVGLPKVEDIQLLEVDTVEQQPTLLASANLKKAYVKLFNSRGMYVAPDAPEDDTTTGMVDIEYRTGEDDETFVADVPQLPYTRRIEVMDAGSWRSHGKMFFRNVCGHPVEILSIIPDFEIDRR